MGNNVRNFRDTYMHLLFQYREWLGFCLWFNVYPHTGPHIVFCDGQKLLDNVKYLFWEGEGEPKDMHFVLPD